MEMFYQFIQLNICGLRYHASSPMSRDDNIRR